MSYRDPDESPLGQSPNRNGLLMFLSLKRKRREEETSELKEKLIKIFFLTFSCCLIPLLKGVYLKITFPPSRTISDIFVKNFLFSEFYSLNSDLIKNYPQSSESAKIGAERQSLNASRLYSLIYCDSEKRS